MTELDRAKGALAKGIGVFEDEETALKKELAEAVVEHDRARSFLMSHQESRKDTLAPFHADIAAAEKADIDQQTKRLLNSA